MAKQYYMSENQMRRAFEKFKDDERMKNALEKGWLIYLRENGFLGIDPESLRDHIVTIKDKQKLVKAELSSAKMKKIEQNYCLYH